MTTESKKPLKLFYCYAREDKALRDELDIHLSSLKRQSLVTSWYDGAIGPGTEWEKEIDTHLRNANIILLLVTPSFMASDYCYDIEMKRALERHQAGTARVIPIMLRRTFWNDAPFNFLQILPPNAKPINQWPDRDEAFWDIIMGIYQAITELHTLLQEHLHKDSSLNELKQPKGTTTISNQATRLDPNAAYAYGYRDCTLYNRRRYEETIAVYNQAIRLDPDATYAYINKGLALHDLKRYEEAIAAYNQVIRLNPNATYAHNSKGLALHDLKRYEEAIIAYDQAIRLDPNTIHICINKNLSLEKLHRPQTALHYLEKIR
jgi:tetratricopeptide (TPR) repeat protein